MFCESHPLIEYRTDLFISDNHIFIPPGESRTITIEAPLLPKGGLSLLQTGWRISCWNAEEFLILSSEEVLLSMGRRDAMCREYAFYSDPVNLSSVQLPNLEGRMISGTEIPFMLDQSTGMIHFTFNVDTHLIRDKVRLRIHTADQSRKGAVVKIKLNEACLEQKLPNGLGIQNHDPAHLSFPSTWEVELPSTLLREGKNSLVVFVCDDGWFIWDALDLVTM